MAKTTPVRPASSYSAKRRRQIADAFRAAKQNLATAEQFLSSTVGHKTVFICSAISAAKANHSINAQAATSAQGIVEARLGGYATVTIWLIRHCPHIDPSFQDVLTFRHRWLDDLIREFSA